MSYLAVYDRYGNESRYYVPNGGWWNFVDTTPIGIPQVIVPSDPADDNEFTPGLMPGGTPIPMGMPDPMPNDPVPVEEDIPVAPYLPKRDAPLSIPEEPGNPWGDPGRELSPMAWWQYPLY